MTSYIKTKRQYIFLFIIFHYMSSLNKVQIIGNMTRDAEVKETPNGNKVANFSVATSRFWKDAGGEKQEETEFHNITAWGKLAEIVESYTEKGKKVYIE